MRGIRRDQVAGPGRTVWAVACAAYCLLVIGLGLVSWWYDIHDGGSNGGSFAAVIPLLVTFPLGWLALAIPRLARGGDYNAASDVLVTSFYVAVIALGLLQGWLIWRGGLGIGAWAARRLQRAAPGASSQSL
jgi:hypothetical protein